ncbi:MAG: TorF family putative porin [Comamonas sp.]
MKKFVLALASVVALAALPGAAFAQLTGNISLTSSYKFRGQDQDVLSGGEVSEDKDQTFKPAVQGGFDYAFGNGFYVGNWNSSVSWVKGNSLETDLYGGYKGDLGNGLTYDVGALAYLYPGAGSANTGEIYGALSWSAFTLKYSHTVSQKYFGWEDARNTGYLNLSAAQEIAPRLTLKASIGYTRFSDDARAAEDGPENYVDYGVGLSYDIGQGFTVAGGLYGANKRSYYGYANKNRFILTVSKTL